MTTIARLKLRTGETDEDILSDLLESAKSAILTRRFPYGDYPLDDAGETYLEPRYADLQMRIAEAMYQKLGAGYEKSHSENGISRVWTSEGIPEELLQEIVPKVGVSV